MGLFANPLAGAGFPPNVTGTPMTQNSTVRAATLVEAAAGLLDSVYISPVTLGGTVALDFANPPALGYGSTTMNTPIHSGTITLADAANIVVGSTTGTQIGTATSQKLGFFAATPIVQPAAATDIKVALVNLGLLATGASPLNLGSAALTAGNGTFEQVNSTATGTDIAGTFTAATALISAVKCVTGSIQVPATTVAGATPVINNVRTGQVGFTGNVAAGATGALVMTNSIIASGSIIIATISCATAGSGMVIYSIVPGTGTVTFNTKNTGGTDTTGNNININFWVLN